MHNLGDGLGALRTLDTVCGYEIKHIAIWGLGSPQLIFSDCEMIKISKQPKGVRCNRHFVETNQEWRSSKSAARTEIA